MDIPRYRIGNDLTVLWAICNNDGTPFDLSGKGVRLFVTNDRGMTEVVPTITTDKNGSITNVILWTFLGNNQKVLGKHTLTVEIVTADDKRVIKRDISDAFNLVARSEGEESGGEANAVDSGTIYLSTKLDVYRFGNARVEIGTNGNWFIDGYDTGRTALAGEPGIVHNIYTESDLGKEFDPDSKIDTFNAHAINAINNALKKMTLEQLQDLSLADLEEYDVLAYNGNAWLNVPFRDLLNIFKGPSESSSGIGDGFWYLNEQDGKIHTDIGIVVHGDAIVEGDTSSGGSGEDVVVGIQGVRVNGTTHYDEDGDGVVDLGTIESGGGGLTSVSWGDIQGTPPSVSTFDNDVPYVDEDTFNSFSEDVNSAISEVSGDIDDLSSLLSSMWHLDENGNIVTDKQVLIKNNLIIDGDTSSGGEGKDTPSGGISGVKVNGVTYYDDNGDGVIDLGTISGGGGTADLSNYYTKGESDARYLALSGGEINGSGYIPFSIKSNDQDEVGIRFIGYDGRKGHLLYGGDSTYLVTDNGWYNAYTLIHSGNIGSYNAGGAKKLTPYNGICDYAAGISTMSFFTDWGLTNTLGSYLYGISMESPDASYKVQVGHALWKGLYWRDMDAGTWTPWRKIISEDGNGNVGIGTTNPTSKLHIVHNTYPNILLESSSIESSIYFKSLSTGQGWAAGTGVWNQHFGIGLYEGGTSQWILSLRKDCGTDIRGGLQIYRQFYGSFDEGIRVVGASNEYCGIFLGTDSQYYGYTDHQWNLMKTNADTFAIARGLSTNVFFQISNNGDTNINGNLIVSGDTSSGSDIRFKDIIKNKTIKIEHIAKAPLFTFKWNDREDDTIHLGSSAQYWENIAPWLVKGEDFKTLDYSTLGVAMGISLAKKAVNHEERIKALEKEIKRLKEEMIHG